MTGIDLGDALGSFLTAVKWLAITSTVFVPLGIWKLIEILVWVF